MGRSCSMWLFNFIKSRGVSDLHASDNKLTSLLNILSFLTAMGSFGIFLMTLVYIKDPVYMCITIGVTLTYLVLIVLHHFHFIREARIYFSTVIPFWYVLTMLLVGGHFGQSIAAAATVGITYMMFKDRPRLQRGLMIYNVLLFVLPTIYITAYNPIFGVRNYPFDEIVVFCLCVGWISIVFSVFETQQENNITTLKKQNSKLEKTTKELETFNYIASHDLKSPLRNIISFMKLMERELNKGNTENVLEYMSYMENGAYQMHELIQDILEISKIDNGKAYNPVDLNLVLNKVITSMEQDIQNKNAVILSDMLPVYFGAESDFVSIFQNLIENGLKYNLSDQPTVKITCSSEPGSISLNFIDNGIGISPEYHKQIFEFFKRLHASDDYPGTGLGLGLCNKIIQKYGGKIAVKSTEGNSSAFTLHLPTQEHIQQVEYARKSVKVLLH